MRMLRDSKATEADTVVPFGKYKTWYYRELPQGYLQWAVQETRSGNSHPDLVRLANWARTVLKDPTNPAEKEQKETLDDPETTAKTAPPKMERRLRDVPLSSDGSWAPVNFRPAPAGAGSARTAATAWSTTPAARPWWRSPRSRQGWQP